MVQSAELTTYPDRMNATQTASYIHVSKPVVLRELAAGRLPGRRLGRRWIVDRNALDEWLRANEQPEPRDAA